MVITQLLQGQILCEQLLHEGQPQQNYQHPLQLKSP